MNDSQPSRPVGRTAYPYFEVKLWRGRLPAPVQLRGTSIARQFERGAIGGKKVACTERFADTPAGRRDLLLWTRRRYGEDFEVDYIESPQRCRVRVPTQALHHPGFEANGLSDAIKR